MRVISPAIESLLGILANGGTACFDSEAFQSAAEFVELAQAHGVVSLLVEQFAGPRFNGWRPDIVGACCNEARTWAMQELAYRVEVARVLGELASAEITPLIIKGTSLAYSLYPKPVLRPRADVDLLVERSCRAQAEAALHGAEYSRVGIHETNTFQSSWKRQDRLGAVYSIDLHWETNNSPVLARLLTYTELLRRAVPLPALGNSARGPAFVDSLLLACIHRAGHAHAPYYVGGKRFDALNRLIWLYDIHLLVSTMTPRELDEWVELARAKNITRICLDALFRARDCFGTNIPANVLEELTRNGKREPSAQFLTANRARLLVQDVWHLESWRQRVKWIRHLALPSASYMRRKYSDAVGTWLPALYARRATVGMARLCARRHASTE